MEGGISSKDNAKLKNIRVLLKDKRARKEQKLFLVEGATLFKETPSTLIKEVFVREGDADALALALSKTDAVYTVSSRIFDGLSDTVSPCGLLAVVKNDVDICSLGNKILILDGIRDPGNAGTLVRSAAGFGFSAVIAVNCCDLYEAKVVRATMGGIFKSAIKICDTIAEALQLIEGRTLAVLDMGGKSLVGADLTSFALVVGSESHGVSTAFRQAADVVLKIDADGIESLNAAVAGSIAMYELCKK